MIACAQIHSIFMLDTYNIETVIQHFDYHQRTTLQKITVEQHENTSNSI